MSEAVDNSAAPIDKEALKQNYTEECDQRLRLEGNEQYIEIKDQLAPCFNITGNGPGGIVKIFAPA